MLLRLLFLCFSTTFACYGSNITEPYCWTSDNHGTVNVSKCPPALVMQFLKKLEHIDDVTSYDVPVHFTMPPNFHLIEKPDISHYNLHACRKEVTKCDPSYAQVTNLITTTFATSTNLTGDTIILNQTSFNLTSGNWTVIAHVRFHTNESGDDVQWDACIGQNVSVAHMTLKYPAIVKESNVTTPALITMFSIFVFVIAVFFIRRWLRKREHRKVELSQTLRRSLIREIVILVFDVCTGIVARFLQVLSFRRIVDYPEDQQYGVVIPYAVFTLLATCATIVVIFFQLHLMKQAINQLLGKRKTETAGKTVNMDGSIFELRLPVITDADPIEKTIDRIDSLLVTPVTPIPSSAQKGSLLVDSYKPQWDSRHCDAKIHRLTRSIRNMQLVICMAIIEDLPLITMNCYLMYHFNVISQHESIVASIIASLLKLGYNTSFIRILKEAWYQRDRLVASIGENEKSPEARRNTKGSVNGPPLDLHIEKAEKESNEDKSRLQTAVGPLIPEALSYEEKDLPHVPSFQPRATALTDPDDRDSSFRVHQKPPSSSFSTPSSSPFHHHLQSPQPPPPQFPRSSSPPQPSQQQSQQQQSQQPPPYHRRRGVSPPPGGGVSPAPPPPPPPPPTHRSSPFPHHPPPIPPHKLSPLQLPLQLPSLPPSPSTQPNNS